MSPERFSAAQCSGYLIIVSFRIQVTDSWNDFPDSVELKDRRGPKTGTHMSQIQHATSPFGAFGSIHSLTCCKPLLVAGKSHDEVLPFYWDVVVQQVANESPLELCFEGKKKAEN